MPRLTREEQTVIIVAVLLFLTGLAVKTWRTAHPAELSQPNPAISMTHASDQF